MFIYILAKDCDWQEDIDDMVYLATTDIQKILDYLTIERAKYLGDYVILIKPDGSEDYELFYVNTDLSDSLRKYPPKMLLDNKELLGELIFKTKVWCDNIKFQLEEEKRRKEEEKNRKQEEKDRALYEKLKAKFENQ